MKVYKYRSVNDKEILNRDINSFKKNQFYAPNFKSLNDKFEANFDEIISNVINILGKVFSADTSELEKNITEIISYKEKLGIFCLSKIVSAKRFGHIIRTIIKGIVFNMI